MKTTPHFRIPYPEGSDPAKQLSTYLANLALGVDNVMYGLDPENPDNPPLAARVAALEAIVAGLQPSFAAYVLGSTVTLPNADMTVIPLTKSASTEDVVSTAGGMRLPAGTWALSAALDGSIVANGYLDLCIYAADTQLAKGSGARPANSNEYTLARITPVIASLTGPTTVTLRRSGAGSTSVDRASLTAIRVRA